MVDILMIKADDPKVLSQYHKQKLEFHFQQKSDNDFVRFLLDTAVRVISIGNLLEFCLFTMTQFFLELNDETDLKCKNWCNNDYV